MKKLLAVLTTIILLILGCASTGKDSGYYTPHKVGNIISTDRTIAVNLNRGQVVSRFFTFNNRMLKLNYTGTRTDSDMIDIDFYLEADKFRIRGFVITFIVTDNLGKITRVIKNTMFREGDYKFNISTPYFNGMRITLWARSLK